MPGNYIPPENVEQIEPVTPEAYMREIRELRKEMERYEQRLVEQHQQQMAEVRRREQQEQQFDDDNDRRRKIEIAGGVCELLGFVGGGVYGWYAGENIKQRAMDGHQAGQAVRTAITAFFK